MTQHSSNSNQPSPQGYGPATGGQSQYGQPAFQGMNPGTTAQQLFSAVQMGYQEAKYQAEMQLAIDRNEREREAHTNRQKAEADRATAEAERNRLDGLYRQGQVQYQQDRNDIQRAQFAADAADRMARTYGQLLYWEEELMLRRTDVAERHKQGWKRIELEALTQRANLEIAKWRAAEGQRHNQVLEVQDLQSRIDRRDETLRHNRQTEMQDWMVQQARLAETERHNRAQEGDQGRRTDLMEDDYDVRHRDMSRRSDLMEQNYEDQQRIAYWRYLESVNHNVVMEQFQAERGGSRPGGRLLGALVVLLIFGGLFLFMAYCFVNWTHFK
jgi:hypothetical protein